MAQSLKQSTEHLDKEIGARVRDFRAARGMSQERLGDALGITFQQVQKYEKGINRISMSAGISICRELAIDIRDLVGANLGDVDSNPGLLATVLAENRALKAKLASIGDQAYSSVAASKRPDREKSNEMAAQRQ